MRRIKWDLIILLVILAGTLVIYSRVLTQDFVNYDDWLYVQENQQVLAGLSTDTLIWSFQLDVPLQWHPLTHISYLIDGSIDRAIHGSDGVPNAWIYKAHNVLHHMLSSVLLFLFLRLVTPERFRLHAAAVACLFAWHPVNVESVAWVSERKNTLSTLFWITTLLAYFFYLQKINWKRYLLVTLSLCAALLSKPMAVTLPAVLLLMDVWPSRRVQAMDDKPRSVFGAQPLPLGIVGRGYVIEKLPWFAASLAMSAMTIVHHHYVLGIVESAQGMSWSVYVNNIFSLYGQYVRMVLLPINLHIPYASPPGFPDAGWPLWMAVLGALTIACATLGAWKVREQAPAILIGWLWFVGTLLPVADVFPISNGFAGADRDLYVPAIGLFIAVVFGLGRFASENQKSPTGGQAQIAVAVIALAACFALSVRQVNYWDNPETLFTHQIETGPPHWMAYSNRGRWRWINGRLAEAEADFLAAIKTDPTKPLPYRNLGNLLEAMGDTSAAVEMFEKTESLGNWDPKTPTKLGDHYRKLGQLDVAMTWYSKALAIDETYIDAHIGTAKTFAQLGKTELAAKHLESAEQLLNRSLATTPGEPELTLALVEVYRMRGKWDQAIAETRKIRGSAADQSEAAFERGVTYRMMNRPQDAAEAYREAIELDGENAVAMNNLGVILAMQGDVKGAHEQFRAAVRALPSYADARQNLARAQQQLQAGRADEAGSAPEQPVDQPADGE